MTKTYLYTTALALAAILTISLAGGAGYVYGIASDHSEAERRSVATAIERGDLAKIGRIVP